MRSDIQARELLSSRENIPSKYERETFGAGLRRPLSIQHGEMATDTEKTLYLMGLRA